MNTSPRTIQAIIVATTLSLGSLQHYAFAKENNNTAAPVTQAPVSKLIITDTQTGEGAQATAGQQVTVHYTGWLYDPNAANFHGKKFDSSHDRAKPFEFPLGAHRVIQGWDKGVAGMRVGGKRTLIIPSDLAYGERGAGGVIPPGSTLVFDVELLAVK